MPKYAKARFKQTRGPIGLCYKHKVNDDGTVHVTLETNAWEPMTIVLDHEDALRLLPGATLNVTAWNNPKQRPYIKIMRYNAERRKMEGLYLHRMIMSQGTRSTRQVRFCNGNTLDMRRANLRLA